MKTVYLIRNKGTNLVGGYFSSNLGIFSDKKNAEEIVKELNNTIKIAAQFGCDGRSVTFVIDEFNLDQLITEKENA